MFDPTKEDAWKHTPVPSAVDELNVDIQFRAGRRCVVVRSRAPDSIVASVVVIPFAVFKGIMAALLTTEANAEHAAGRSDIAIARTLPPTDPKQ